MIGTKIIVKPKGNSGTGNGSGVSGYGGEYVSEADYAARAGKAKKAESADLATRANMANTADRAKYADKAGELDEEAEVLQRYIRKDIDDLAQGTVIWEKVQKLMQGLNISEGNGTWSADGTLKLFRLLTNNFSSGPSGQGAQIDEKGNLEVQSIYARKFMSAPKFAFNEISVTKAEQWNTNGYGTIESVDVKNRTITLHLEENDYGSLQVGDICRGLYADIDNAHGADKIEEGALDDCNFVQHKGFFSTYFYVMHIITNEKGKFVFQYGKKSSVTPDPCAYMDFAQYGSFTDEKRQSSMYFSSRRNSFIEVLDGVKTWEVQSQNRVARYGWLGGLLLVKKDGSTVRPEGNGIYVQDNIYFGGNINYLQGLSGLDDLREEAKAYDVSLSQYQSVITVDDMGNVINGLYTEDEAKTTKQYRISTAVFVRKGMDILLEEDGNTEDVTAGHYRVHAVSEDCEVMVQNSTIFVTAIRNIKDGVAGTTDDANFDYDAMRKATDAMVTIVVELEGKTSKMVQMPIRIQHDTLPFMVCDLSNESASVAWNTKTAKYIGLPIKTKVSLLYHNEPWTISSLNISKVAGLKTSMSIEGKAKVITIDADNLTADTLAQVTKMNITVVGRYAGANYEYTRELTILKSSDTVVYELIPSADSIVVDKDGNKTVNSVSCDVYATSSDDKRYKLTALPSGMTLKYGKSENATTAVALGTAVDVLEDDKMVTFALYDSKNNMLDKESIPVLAYGKDGKGIEYIFKLQNSAPSNPTPSDYATDTEYQRTDYVPTTLGWTDDPTGVDAVNQYEWVCKRVSTNGHWGAFSDPAEYAHFGKHAPKASSTDDIVTIPTDSNGKALVSFSEEVGFSLRVNGTYCPIPTVTIYSSTLSDVSCSVSSNVATIECTEGVNLGTRAMTVVFKVVGTLNGGSYVDYVTVKVVPNVTGADGDGYEYIYYLSNSSTAPLTTPYRSSGKLYPDGWQDDPMAPTVDNQYVYVAYKKGVVGSNGTFSAPKLFNHYPKSISKQETRFYAHSSLSPAPDASTIWNSGSTSMPTNFSDEKPWLWKIIRTTYTDGTTADVVSCEGYKAKDGIGIKSVNTWYGLSDYSSLKPDSFDFDTLSKAVIEKYKEKFVWSADKVVYTNGSEALTGIYCIGKCADLTSVTEQYGTSTSDTDKPTSWKDVYPKDAPKGTYIWSRDAVKWKDGTTTYSAAQLIGYIATDGLHAPKATCDDDKVTIPTDSNGVALSGFSETIRFSLYVNGVACSGISVTMSSSTLENVDCDVIGSTVFVKCSSGVNLGTRAMTVVFKVEGSLNGESYSDYVTVKVVPNVTGADGDGYEYVFLLSDSQFAPGKPSRTNGKLSGDWVDDPPSPTDDKRYVYVSYFHGEVGTPNVPSTQWSPPALWTYKAPKGDKGDQGDKGNPGDKGDKGDDGKDGVGIVTAYQRASALPAKKPEVTNYNTYKDVEDLGNKWQKSAPTSNDDLFEGGSISGTVLYNQNVSGGNWQSGVSDGGFTWYKSPTVASNGKASMQIHFTTTANNQYVTFYLKAYSEKTYDPILLSKIDSAEVSKSNCSAQTSGEGVEISVKLKCDKAGQHFVTVAYTKDGSGDKFGDYGLVRMATTENYVHVDVSADSLDGDIIAGKNITSGNYALVKGGSILGTPNTVNAADWRTSYYEDSDFWYKSPTVADNGIATMQIHFSTKVDNQYVTFYLKSYSEKNCDFILLSEIDSTEIDRTDKFSFRASGDGVKVNAKLKCGKAGQHFVTVAYAKDGSGKLADDKDFGLVRMDTADNYVWVDLLLYRCDGEVASDKTITWGNIYQAMGDKGEKGDKGDKGESGASGGRGTRGPIPRTHKGAESGSYKYLQGSESEEYVDLVYDKESATWYRCIKTYESSSPNLKDTTYWEASVTKGWTFMATELLLAENGRIDMLSSQEINLLSDMSTLFGSFRHVKDNADYAFWLGGKTGAAATTSITRGGKLKSTSAEITGKIVAMSGQIGGLKIEGDALTNQGFNNDAYIVLRNDTNKVFAGIGGNVLPATAGDTQAVARFTIENTNNSFIGGINYAIICGAKGKATNVALDMTLGGYVTGLRIKNTFLASGGTISQAVNIPKNAHSVVLAGSGYYKLPQMEKEDDGYIVFIKRATDRGAVHLLSGLARDSKDSLHTSVLYYDRGNGTTDLEIKSSGDAMILVYHREMVYNNTYQGCWIQYKCPRDW